MSNSTPTYDALVQSQSSKEITVNAYFDAVSPATAFGRRASTCSGLTWGYYGANLRVDGSALQIANGTLTLSANAVNYIDASRAGVVSANITGFTIGAIQLYTVVVGAASVTSYTDHREMATPHHLTSNATVTLTTTDMALSRSQARCRYVTISGTLTGNRAVIVPNNWEGIVYNANTGGYTTTISTNTGTGVIVAQGKRALLYADGTNVVRVTADA